MKFFERLKRDNKFRVQVVVIGLILFALFISSQPEKKTWTPQETCSKHPVIQDNPTLGLLDFSGACIGDGCFVKLQPLGLVTIPYACIQYGDTGDIINDPMGCLSGKSEEVTGLWDHPVLNLLSLFGDKGYRCEYVANPPNDAEREIAEIVQDMGIFEDNAKTAYYVVIIGGGFLALMMLGVML